MKTQKYPYVNLKSNLVDRQARLLMVDQRQRQSNRQANMLERASQQIGL